MDIANQLWFAAFCLHLFVCEFLKNDLNNLKKVFIHLKLPLICLNLPQFASICLKISQNFSKFLKMPRRLRSNTDCSIGGLGQFTSKCLKMPQNFSKFLKISQNIHDASFIPNKLLICLVSCCFFLQLPATLYTTCLPKFASLRSSSNELQEHCHQVQGPEEMYT